MRFVICGICGNEKSPTNASLLIDDVVHCENCLKEKFPNDVDLKRRKVVQQFDPTICMSCSKDSGDIPFRLHGSYPMCEECGQALAARIFPTWVKGFFAGVVVLVVFSLVWNWRFIEAYYLIKKTDVVVPNGTPQDIATLYTDISTNVPEVDDFKQMANYFRGIWMMSEDKSAEALELFKSCTAVPNNFNIGALTLQAEIGVLYDKKDYPGFADAAKRYLAYDTSAVGLAQVASAYACLYADQKSDSAKSIAMDYLQRAINTQDTTRFFSAYVNRIEHRLTTGEIIDHKTFEARFPNGWTKP